jgi:cystathionine beta-lyase
VHDPFGFDSLDAEWLRSKSGAKWHRHPGQLAAWVADMDFPPAPVVLAALRARLESGDLGYPDWRSHTGGTPICELFAERAAHRFGWSVDVGEVREVCDVMQAVQAVLHVATQPGDGVVVLTPSYPPLMHSVTGTGRRLIDQAVTADGWDLDELDDRLTRERATVLLLCHPHNPTGHVFTSRELRRLGEIAARHDLLIISDEIHADLTYSPNVHLPIAAACPEHAARIVTIHSASKAFNLAGLRYALAHIGSPGVRVALASLPDHLLGAVNLMAADATWAAWSDGDEWLAAVLVHLDRNRALLADLLATHLPEVRYTPPAATYLAWLDCRAIGDGDAPFELFRGRGVQLSPGTDFGENGGGFVRLNMATSSALLTRIVSTMAG